MLTGIKYPTFRMVQVDRSMIGKYTRIIDQGKHSSKIEGK